MVKHFLASQSRKIPGQTRRNLATSVASTFNRGQTTARNMIRWENSWVVDRKIPERDDGESNPAWVDDEDVKMSVRNFAKK